MRGGESTRLEAQPRQEGVGLDDSLERGSHRMGLVSLIRLLAVLEQDLLALLADRRRDLGLQASTKVGAVHAPARLDVRRDRVTHAGGEEARRRPRHDGCVDEDNRGVFVEEGVAVELARGAVEYGQRGAGRVGRGGGRDDRDLEREPVRDGFGSVNGLSSAERDDEVGTVVLADQAEAINLLARGLATEDGAVNLELGGFESRHEALSS